MSLYLKIGIRGHQTLVDDDIAEDLGRFKWSISTHGYVCRMVTVRRKNFNFLLHRVIMDALPSQILDHANGDRLDNRRENLRVATYSENNRNRASRVSGTSRYLGVHWDTDRCKWFAGAYDMSTHKKLNLGRYENEVEAAKAYDRYASKYYGEFAKLNFP